MVTSIIEKYNKTRYNIIKWFTIGWAIWYGRYLMDHFTQNKIILQSSLVLGMIGMIIWFVNLVRLKKLGKIINADLDLKNALNDELVMHNRNKALIVGYIVLMISVALFYVLTIFMTISPKLICAILLYLGVLSVLIAALVLNRD